MGCLHVLLLLPLFTTISLSLLSEHVKLDREMVKPHAVCCKLAQPRKLVQAAEHPDATGSFSVVSAGAATTACADVQRHQESYMRRELKWESTLAHLQQQLGLLKGEGTTENAAAAAEGQAKQLSTIRQVLSMVLLVQRMHTCLPLRQYCAPGTACLQSAAHLYNHQGPRLDAPAHLFASLPTTHPSLRLQRNHRVLSVMACSMQLLCVNPTSV